MTIVPLTFQYAAGDTWGSSMSNDACGYSWVVQIRLGVIGTEASSEGLSGVEGQGQILGVCQHLSAGLHAYLLMHVIKWHSWGMTANVSHQANRGLHMGEVYRCQSCTPAKQPRKGFHPFLQGWNGAWNEYMLWPTVTQFFRTSEPVFLHRMSRDPVWIMILLPYLTG